MAHTRRPHVNNFVKFTVNRRNTFCSHTSHTRANTCRCYVCCAVSGMCWCIRASRRRPLQRTFPCSANTSLLSGCSVLSYHTSKQPAILPLYLSHPLPCIHMSSSAGAASTQRPLHASSEGQHHQQHHHEGTTADPRFSCNICFDDVSDDPVVTQCGHLYCWSCLFRWIEPGLTPNERHTLQLPPAYTTTGDRRVCPVCKSPCSLTSIIPIYVRSSSSSSGGASGTENSTSNDPSPKDVESRMHSREAAMETQQQQQQQPGLEEDPSHFGLRQCRRVASNGTTSTDSSNTTSTTSSPLPPASPPQHSASDVTEVTTNVSNRNNNNNNEPFEVPARPTPPRRRSFSENAVVGRPPPPPYERSSLAVTQGLALTLHRALGPTSNNNTNNIPVPPLHRPQGHGSSAVAAAAAHFEGNGGTMEETDATEFLSRILLMLGSFVVLCLLLF